MKHAFLPPASASTVLLAALALSALHTTRAEPIAPFEERSLTYTGGEYENETFRYLLLKPDEIKEGEQYPVVLFLHGAGERGDDNAVQMAHFPVLFQDEALRKRFPCFLIAPQCRVDRRWTTSSWEDTSAPSSKGAPADEMNVAVQALLATLDEHPVDRSRIYLTGLSMGGYGSWDLSVRQPDWFAAVAPICGGGDVDLAHRLASTPVWAYHGDADGAVPVKRSRDMIEAIRRAGGLPRYTEVPGRGHDSWVPAYRDDQLVIPWMFGQRQRPLAERALPGLEVLASAATPLIANERIVFLGDSLTAAGVRKDGYITLLQEAIRSGRPDLDVQLIGAGISGHKVPDIQARLQRDVLSVGPTVVFILIGVNDVWHSESGNGTSPSAYEQGLRDVLTRIQQAGATAILATPPLIGEKPNGENRLDTQLDEFAALSRKVATRFGVTICDLRTSMPSYLRVFNETGAGKGILTSDEVHFSADGDKYVANHVALSIYEALTRARR